MHPKLIIKNIINGCFFQLTSNIGRCINFVSGPHEEDEVIVMAEIEIDEDLVGEIMMVPMCNIYPKREYTAILEAFAMDMMPEEAKLFGEFWVNLINGEKTDIDFLFIEHTREPLIQQVQRD